MNKYIFIISMLSCTFQLLGQSPSIDIEGGSFFKEPIEIQGSDLEFFPDLIINSDRALMHLGDGRPGPHGIIFGDEQSEREMRLFYRTGPHKLTMEYGSQVFYDFEEIFSVDTLGNTQIGGSLKIGNVSVPGQTRMLTVDQDGNVGSQVIPTAGTNSNSFLEIPILDQAGSANSYTLKNFQDRDASGFPFGPRSFQLQRIVPGQSPLNIMDLNPARGIFEHENSIGAALEFRNDSTSPSAGGISVNIGTSSAILSESNKFVTFRAGGQEVGAVKGQQSISSLISQVANSIFPSNPSQNSVNSSSSSSNDVNNVEDRNSQLTQNDQGSEAPNINALLENEIVLDAMFMTMDFIVSVIGNITNLWGAIGGAAIFGDVDDAIWSAVELTNTIVQYASYLAFIDIHEGISYESGNGDYAEWLLRADQNEKIVAGNIVGVKGGEISKTFLDAERFMVISDQPFVLGNMPAEGESDQYEKVAFLGQVPVRVLGQVNKGDYILPSGNQDGFGIAVSPKLMKTKDYSRIVGIAWQESEKDQIISTINTAVGINANDIAYQVEKMLVLLNKMQVSLAQLDPSFEASFYVVEGSNMQETQDRTVSPTLREMTSNSIHENSNADLTSYGANITKEQALEITKIHFQKAKQVIEQQGISLDRFPYMDELFNDPSPETLAKVQTYYEGALDNVQGLLAQIKSGE